MTYSGTDSKGEETMVQRQIFNTKAWNGRRGRALLLSLVLVAAVAGPAASFDTVDELTLKSLTPGELEIEWTAPELFPTDYRVNWGRADQRFPGWRDSSGNDYVTGTALTLHGLEPGADYQVRVRARYAQGHPEGRRAGPFSAAVVQRVDDYHDDTDTEGTIDAGSSVDGDIDSAGDVDWFAVALTASLVYDVTVWDADAESGLGSQLIGVDDADGTLVSEGVAWSGSTALAFTPSTSGTYHVSVAGTDEATGGYTASVSEGAVDLGDPTDLEGSGSYSENVGGADRIDYYRFSLTALRDVALELRGLQHDADLFLEDGAGGVLASSTASGAADERIAGELAAGVYYVRVASDEASQTTYTLGYSLRTPLPVFGHDGYAFTLIENKGGSVSRVLLGSVAATAAGGGEISYSLVGGNASGLFELNGASGELYYTGSGEDYEAANRQVFELTVRATVGAASSDVVVSVTVTDVSGDSEPLGGDLSASSSTDGLLVVDEGAVTGRVGVSGDVDWFRVELEPGTLYRVLLSSRDDASPRPVIRGVRDADGNPLPVIVSPKGNVVFEIDATAAQTIYYVVVGSETTEAETSGPTRDLRDGGKSRDRSDYRARQKPGGSDYRVSVRTGVIQDSGHTRRAVEVDGVAVLGRILHLDQEVWFSVTLASGTTYLFTVERGAGSSLVKSMLRGIYDADDVLVPGTTRNPAVPHNPEYLRFTATASGTFYVSVGGIPGPYLLSVEEEEAMVTDDFSADKDTTGTVTTDGTATSAEFESVGDRDWFAVMMEAEKIYRIAIEGKTTGAGFREIPGLRGIHDADGALVPRTTSPWNFFYGYGYDLDPKVNGVVFRPAVAGTYYLSIGSLQGTGTYEVSVSGLLPDDFTADKDTTGVVAVAGSTTGILSLHVDDRDWFKIELTAAKTYRFDLQTDVDNPDSVAGSLMDPCIIGIYDADGTLIPGTRNDNGGELGNAKLKFTPGETGTYYVSAGSTRHVNSRARWGKYVLTVTDVTDGGGS